VSNQIIQYCDSQEGDARAWYWKNVKVGMQQILMYRTIAIIASSGLSLSQTVHSEEIWATGVSCISGLALCYALYSLHAQAKKIEIAVQPYLKITFRSVTPILQTGREAGGYGSFSEGADSHVAVEISGAAKKEPAIAASIGGRN
jgi:hypothetical protein